MSEDVDPTPTPQTLADIDLRRNERLLVIAGRPVTLGGRAFDVLEALLEHGDRAMSKSELMERVWPNLVVEENNLQVQVSSLRKVLGAQAIVTIPGRGYKLALAPAPVPQKLAAAPGNSRPFQRVAAARGQEPSPTNLRPTNAPIYGRGDDLAAIRRLLAANAVVSVVGAGGIGKTRLAQAVAAGCDEAFPDGIWWVELASIADPALVPSTVARAVGAHASEGRSSMQALENLLAAQQALLVLDNCEHVADAVVTFVEEIVAVAPDVRLLITSQEPLRSAQEQLYRLGPLTVPAPGEPLPDAPGGAAELFLERARALDPRFVLNAARWPAVVEICRRLDGLPLAIEMAAARLPLLGLEGLRQRLDERFNLLTGNARTVLRRHQTLRATLDWSHSLLDVDEQVVLRRLGVFAGTFSLKSAELLASDERIDTWSALDHLGALVDKSLVMAEGDEAPRYRLLETTRAYALERLGEAGETNDWLRRHAEVLRDMLADLQRGGWTTAAADRQAVAGEVDNLRAALAWARGREDCAGLAIEIGSLSMPIWQAAVAMPEGIEALIGLATLIDERTSAPVQARLWKTLARLGAVTARRECFEAAERAAAIYRLLGDVDNLYEALIARAAIGSERADGATVEALDEALRIEHEALSPRLRGNMAWARSRWLNRSDRFEEAMQSVMSQAELYRSLGLEGHAAIAEGANVAACEVALGRPRSAEARARQSLIVLDREGLARAGGHVRMTLLQALSDQGRYDEAVDEARRALPLLLAEGDDFRLLEPLALNAALQGRPADAAFLLGYADQHRADNGAIRTPAQQRRRDRIDRLLAEALTAEVAELSFGDGAKATHAAAFSHAFGDATISS